MIVVCDTSPLTNLAAVGQFDLLRQLFGIVHITQEVTEELSSGGRPHPGRLETEDAEWISCHRVDNLALIEVLRRDLDKGEAATLALELDADVVLLDEREARSVALRLGLDVAAVLVFLSVQKRTASSSAPGRWWTRGVQTPASIFRAISIERCSIWRASSRVRNQSLVPVHLRRSFMFISRFRFVATTLLVALSLSASADDSSSDTTERYRDTAGRILGAAMTDVEGWEKLTYLTTVVGHRLSGSPQLEEAIAWAHARMAEEGLETRLQPVMVPHWVRGDESLHVVSPRPRELPMLGLGGSVGTPQGGIEAPVIVVSSFDELDALGREAVEGKIVVYAVPWLGYGGTVRYRGRGASRAAALGAVAALVRSATGLSVASPHTGGLRYDEEQPKIPAAAITVEDAEWFARMQALGREVTVRLDMDAATLDAAESANVIAEIRGRELPDEVVVMGGHYDSWDVGQGAHDDGAACMAAWQALKILHQLGLRPRRTLRVVLWTNEENGLAGGRAYREAEGDDVGRHVAAIEMDGGAERPIGFGFSLGGTDEGEDEDGTGDPAYEQAVAKLRAIARLLEGIGAGEILPGGGGADVGPLMRDGVPGLALRTVGEHYFDWHHTEADTLDKVDPQNVRKAIAMLGVMGYVLADMPERLVPSPTDPG